ncbi:MAG TPA: hypothetical protein VEO54_30695 [Thermoanaerobaculia bacterium]|nr:hypothetical protein [Thermoanaerobaculia bacterium]
MSRKFLIALVCLVLPAAAHALHFTPANPIGLPAYPQVTAVAASETVVYAAAGANLFRSDDDGATWTTLAIPTTSIHYLAVDPVDRAIVYISGQNRTYRSDDGGLTWKQLSTLSVRALHVDPQNPSTLYLAANCDSFPNPLQTGGGIFKSTDRGDTWTRVGVAIQCLHFLSLDPATPQRLFAGTSNGSDYRTDDAGRTWRAASGVLPVFAVAADPLEPSRRYGLGRGPALHFVTSTDSGATWSQMSAEGLPAGGQQLLIDPATRRLFLLGQSFGLYVSDDLGFHWRHVDAVPAMFATPLTMAAAGEVLYVGTSRGLYRVPMSDPDAPAVIHLGEAAPLRLSVQRITLDPNDASTLYATAYEGHGILNAYRVFRSTDSGRTWERITAEEDVAWRYAIAVDAAGDLYGADRQTMWRFDKATQRWETWHVPDLGTPALFANPRRAGWLYAANAGVASYSTDGGRTWTRIEEVTGGFWSLSIAPNGSDLVGGNNDGAFASSDGGVTWRALPTGRLVTKSIALAPSRPQTIYRLSNTAAGGLQSGLFRSDDSGDTWTALRWPGEREASVPIAVDPRDHHSLWIGTAHSADGGVTWTTEPAPMPSPILALAFDRDGTMLYAVGFDQKIWKAAVRAERRRAVRR